METVESHTRDERFDTIFPVRKAIWQSQTIITSGKPDGLDWKERVMYLCGIFEHDWGYDWIDYMDEQEMSEAKYFVGGTYAGVHMCEKSICYDDMTGYVDQLQDEESLAGDELYVVCYHWTDCPSCMYQKVDFGLTKQEIIQNVLDQKYVEGASYYTMGQMFYETRKVMEGK